MANSKENCFYICPVCFEVSETLNEAHAHSMVFCNSGPSGDTKRKPIKNEFNRYVSTAPRWFLDAIETNKE